MVKYRLIYFDFTGRGEVPRLLFSLANVEFEDKRISTAEWPALKPKTPFGSLPLLEVDDEAGKFTLCQSFVINEYLARKFGYAGKTEMEQIKVKMIMHCVEDAFLWVFFGQKLFNDEEEKAKHMKRYADEQLGGYLLKFEVFLTENSSGSGYFVGNSMTVADLYFIERLRSLTPRFGIPVDLQSYPRIAALKDKVLMNPKVAAWKDNFVNPDKL